MKLITYFSFIYLFLLPLHAIEEQENIPKDPVRFVATAIQAGKKDLLAIQFENAPKWHTYWTNPGDAGLPIELGFYLNGKEVQLSPLELPSPHRFIEEGDIWAYGHEGSYSYFYDLSKSNLESGELLIKGKWLVCKHICLPGSGEVSGKLLKTGALIDVKSTTLLPTPTSTEEILKRFSALPKIKNRNGPDLILTFSKKENTFLLYYSYETDIKLDEDFYSKRNLITPFRSELFDFHHEKLFTDSKGTLIGLMEIEWNGEYQEPEIPFPTNGDLKKTYPLRFLVTPLEGPSFIYEKKFSRVLPLSSNPFEIIGKRLKAISGTTEPEAVTKTLVTKKTTQEAPFMPLIFLWAFLGGLILNFMPCVLPVISLKLFALTKDLNGPRKDLVTHNLLYSLGTLSALGILASIILVLKSAGENVGWGFQLQSPLFVVIMALGLFVMGLNLYGIFEISTPGGKTLGGVTLKDSSLGHFLSGVLATILATPCSAPFLGAALGVAFTSSALMSFLIFMAIGLGLSFPFLLTAMFPGLVRFLPRPGQWMISLKKWLALGLFITAIWLFDIFLALTGSGPESQWALFAALTWAFILSNLGPGKLISTTILKIAALLALLTIHGLLFKELSISKKEGLKQSMISTSLMTPLLKEKRRKGLDWLPWSVQEMKKGSQNADWLFIDFTAKWCLTCKVNEKLVLETDRFKQWVMNNNIKLLLADWTLRDAKIESWLRTQGKAGVPAYFIQTPKGELISLGETLSFSKIEKVFEGH